MSSRRAFLPLLLLVVAWPSLAKAEDQGTADVVVRNAKVITVDRDFRLAQALAIRGDRIAAVGSDADVNRLVGPSTKVVDAKGLTLLPGLYDSHVHPLGAATSEKDHAIPAYSSLADIKKYIADRARVQPKDTWIVVRYAFPTRLDEGRFPTRAELDAVAPDHMVLHQAGPAGMVNTRTSPLGRDPRHA
jgi:predicted amidohydrolase YtcJ